MMAEEEVVEKRDVNIGRPSDQVMSGSRPFPLSMVVGQERIKEALLLSSINNSMGDHFGGEGHLPGHPPAAPSLKGSQGQHVQH